MGKAFSREIDELEKTYSWACSSDVSGLVATLCSTWSVPLISVGSGGSYSAAELHANFHRTFFSSKAEASTPMEMVKILPDDGNASVWFISASGNNIDISRAFQHAALMEPKAVSCLVGRKQSRIKGYSVKYQYTNIFEYVLPSGKDGFLATNSLFGFSTLIYRAYCKATSRPESLPASLTELVRSQIKGALTIEDVLEITDEIWKKDVLHVVFSPQLKAAAIDIESKFIEAGLGSVHLADLRNFAHGRHHWFSKNPESGILALILSDDEDLALRTLDLLPANIPKAHITLDGVNESSSIVGLLLSFHFTNSRGLYRNIDPGRPQVPSYGSKIYRLAANSGFKKSMRISRAAIRRKTRSGVAAAKSRSFWNEAYATFVKSLSKQKFGAIVLDYDGTVVDTRLRELPPEQDICDELNRLLDLGIIIGFATGRGKSIRHDLKNDKVIKKRHWERVVVGYYNGADISKLIDDNSPNGEETCCEELTSVCKILKLDTLFGESGAKVTKRRSQITLEPKELMPETFLWDTVKAQLAFHKIISTEVYRSSHSIDIVPSSVTKLAVIQEIRNDLNTEFNVLAIGDRGRWPGNDSQLLGEPFSLSVDEVSCFPDRCWNLCPPGVRGPQGTVAYLRRLSGGGGVVQFK